MLEEINKKKEKIETVRKQINDLKGQNPGSIVTQFENDIKNYEKAIDEYNSRIAGLSKDMAGAVNAFERHYIARAGLREYFDKTKNG